MKTTAEMIAVMQAYADGKKIEHTKLDSVMLDWVDNEMPSWEWGIFDYRIKPEPKYRPYANAEECFADVKKHGGWVKVGGDYLLLDYIGRENVEFSADNAVMFYEELLRDCVWADDSTPCGVLEEV